MASSISGSLKSIFGFLGDNSFWLLSNGGKISFWYDNWVGNNFAERLDFVGLQHHSLSGKVSDFLVDNNWCLPDQVPNNLKDEMRGVMRLQFDLDICIWKPSVDGIFLVKSVYSSLIGR